jgi:hypothetical protein
MVRSPGRVSASRLILMQIPFAAESVDADDLSSADH